jgi:hypothetical protein
VDIIHINISIIFNINFGIYLLHLLLRITISMLSESPNQAVIMGFIIADGVSSADIFERIL